VLNLSTPYNQTFHQMAVIHDSLAIVAIMALALVAGRGEK
jgi:hypothetical protein